MNILFIGDIMGRSGREALETHLPSLKAKYSPDITIVNVDNAAQGRGVTQKICTQLYDMGADCLTGGNHIWDQREIIPYIDRDRYLLRPMNLPSSVPGTGVLMFDTLSGRRVKVIHLLARVFMDCVDNPFTVAIEEVRKDPIGQGVDAIFVDFHGEATSEKMALAHYLDGQITGLIGTHTHMPTADHHIMEKGTAFMSDAGMTGDFDSVIGMRKDIPLSRFVKNMPGERMIPASGEATLCGAVISVKDNGRAKQIVPIRMGGLLSQSLPDLD